MKQKNVRNGKTKIFKLPAYYKFIHDFTQERKEEKIRKYRENESNSSETLSKDENDANKEIKIGVEEELKEVE